MKISMNIRKGQLVKLNFEGREFEAIVIDPNGLGRGQQERWFWFRYDGSPCRTSSVNKFSMGSGLSK